MDVLPISRYRREGESKFILTDIFVVAIVCWETACENAGFCERGAVLPGEGSVDLIEGEGRRPGL